MKMEDFIKMLFTNNNKFTIDEFKKELIKNNVEGGKEEFLDAIIFLCVNKQI